MPLTEEQVRLIFGLKLKQTRNEKGLSLFGLSKKTGLSKSYLNEIEKGKKYPKTDKIVLLAAALETPYDEMVSMKLTGQMAPVSDIIMSGILKEIPLDLFGIEENNLIDIIASAPEKVTAFISTLFEISRKNDVTREGFYLAALRSYQELNENHFDDLEREARQFIKKYHLNTSSKIRSSELEEILTEEFGYAVDYDFLGEVDYPDEIRSVFIPRHKKLLIAKNVSETQRVFILAKELGYCHLEINQRPLTFTWIKFESFDDVLNNFKASYFAGALILPETELVEGLRAFFSNKKWAPKALHKLMFQFTDSAETFFQRLTNVLPKHFGIKQLYFLRFALNEQNGKIALTKELHLSRNQLPHAVQNVEHYCRKWVSADLLLNKDNYQKENGIRLGTQHSVYTNNNEEYLVIAARNQDPFNEHKKRSVCIGIEFTTRQKKKIAFAEDRGTPIETVGITCERCGITDCEKRVAEAKIYNRLSRNQEIEKRVDALINGQQD